MAKIDLEGFCKAEVLAALYNAARPQGMGFLHYDPTPMTVVEAEELLRDRTDFDYLNGRVMKVDIGGNTLNTAYYDRNNGEGAASNALASLQATGDVNNEAIGKAHSDRTFLSAMEAQAHLDECSEITWQSDDAAVLTLCLVALSVFT